MPSVGQRSWQNKTAVICSIQFMQQHSVLSATVEHKKYQKPAAWTSFPLTEGEPVQSANFCFLCSLLHMHSSAVDLLLQKILAEFGAF